MRLKKLLDIYDDDQRIEVIVDGREDFIGIKGDYDMERADRLEVTGRISVNEELKALTINTVFAEDMRLNLAQSVIDNTEISVVALTELCEDDDELLENAIKALNAAIMKLELVVEDAEKRKNKVSEA